MNRQNITIIAGIVLIMIFFYAQTKRYELGTLGHGEYTVKYKLDRWTGKTWRIERNRWVSLR